MRIVVAKDHLRYGAALNQYWVIWVGQSSKKH
jgi:hypothetical protein